MAVQLIGIGTAVPEFALSQAQVRDLFLAEPDLAPLTARLIRAAATVAVAIALVAG